jgi:hypothetical protein
MTHELEAFYRRWLDRTPSTCRPHFYNLSHQHKTVFLMHTPLEGRLSPPPRSDAVRYAEACRGVLLGWFKETEDLWSSLARALPQNAVGAKLADVRDLVEHVYFTDSIKCETKKEDSKQHKDHASPCICDELNLLENSTLFIAVGRQAWKTIRDLAGPFSAVPGDYQHLKSALTSDRSNLTDVHGVLFKNASTGKFLIPAAFPGGHTNSLRDSYLEYLRDGLAVFSRASS